MPCVVSEMRHVPCLLFAHRMMRLSSRAHGAFDILFVVALLCAPAAFDFVGMATILAYVVALVHLGVTLCTAFPLGIVRAIPFDVHGTIELVLSVFLMVSPFLFGFYWMPVFRNFYMLTGFVLFCVWSLSSYAPLVRPITHKEFRNERR